MTTLLLGVLLVAALVGCIDLWLRVDTLNSENTQLEAGNVNLANDLSKATSKAAELEKLAKRQRETLAEAEKVMDFFKTPLEVTTTKRESTQTEVAPGTYVSTETVTTTYPAPAKAKKPKQKKAKQKQQKPAPKKKSKAQAKARKR